MVGWMSVLLWDGVALAEAPAPPEDDEPTIEELLDATDDVARGASSEAVVDMEVKTKRYERSMKMRVLSKGKDKSLIVILEPAKDAGVATLKNGDNLYNYMPKLEFRGARHTGPAKAHFGRRGWAGPLERACRYGSPGGAGYALWPRITGGGVISSASKSSAASSGTALRRTKWCEPTRSSTAWTF